MSKIETTLTTSGNSVAVRLPKALLEISGLTHRITIEARDGQITIRNAHQPRQNWAKQTQAMLRSDPDPSQEFANLDRLVAEGLDSLEWHEQAGS